MKLFKYMYFKPIKIRTGFRDLKFIFVALEVYDFPRWALVEAGAFQLCGEQSVRRGSQPFQHQRHLLWKPGEDELGYKEIKIYIRNIWTRTLKSLLNIRKHCHWKEEQKYNLLKMEKNEIKREWQLQWKSRGKMKTYKSKYVIWNVQAKRSSYGVAPGGCVCLKESMLEAMFEYAMLYHGQTGLAIQVSCDKTQNIYWWH